MPASGLCCRFGTVDVIWKALMKETLAQPRLKVIAAQPGLLDKLIECNKRLEAVQKSLVSSRSRALALGRPRVGGWVRGWVGDRVLPSRVWVDCAWWLCPCWAARASACVAAWLRGR